MGFNGWLRKTFHNKQPEGHGGRLDTKAKWGAYLLAASLMVAPTFPSILGCSQENRKTPEAEQGIWAEPYRGDILKDNDGNYYMATRGLVKFDQTVGKEKAEGILSEKQARITGQIAPLNAFEFEVSSSIDATIDSLRSNPSVENVNRNYFFPQSQRDNDSYPRSGSVPNCNSGVVSLESKYSGGLWWSDKINLTNGLDQFDSSKEAKPHVTIAVIDVGFNLANREIPYVDKKYHVDFADNDGDVNAADQNRLHGDKVSAILAAMENGNFINGVASSKTAGLFSILPLKILSDDLLPAFSEALGLSLTGDDFRISAAIVYATGLSTTLDVKAINMSLGAPYIRIGFPLLIQSAVSAAKSNGVIVVSAAGNYDRPFSLSSLATFDSVVVGGTDIDDNNNETRYPLSNFSHLNICAPAVKLRIQDGNGNPCFDSGTSFSTPQVAGLVALIKSIKPDASYEEVLQLVRDNADDVLLDADPNPLVNGQTWKRINVERTVKALIPSQGPAICANYPEGSPHRFTLKLNQRLMGCGGGQYWLRFSGLSNGKVTLNFEYPADPSMSAPYELSLTDGGATICVPNSGCHSQVEACESPASCSSGCTTTIVETSTFFCSVSD
jgi:thermitase